MNELINKKKWNLTKIVLPHHTDHFGVMWHGTYLNFLEEARIDALNKVGISYSKLSSNGFELPVTSANIKYKISFRHGEKVLLKTQFEMVNKIRLNCKTFFLKVNGDIGAEALIEIVIVKKINESIKLIRELPVEIEKIFLLLAEGPEI